MCLAYLLPWMHTLVHVLGLRSQCSEIIKIDVTYTATIGMTNTHCEARVGVHKWSMLPPGCIVLFRVHHETNHKVSPSPHPTPVLYAHCALDYVLRQNIKSHSRAPIMARMQLRSSYPARPRIFGTARTLQFRD